MNTPLFESSIRSLPLLGRGKVRDIYAVGSDKLLIVTSDRLSAFDVILPDPIPDKGHVLTAMAAFWFSRLAHIVPNQLTGIDPETVVDADEREQVRGRALVVKRLRPLPIEAVVRGYLIGSGWKDYQASSAICGIPLPSGLRQAARLPQPIFTPASKAEAGEHDENISFERACALCAEMFGPSGVALAEQARDASIALYREAADYAAGRGILIADTKFEFGVDDAGTLHLIDEALTPDSSRFWPQADYREGISPPSFDKQYVRDYLETLDWNKKAPAPRLPEEVIARTAAKYREAYSRLAQETNPLLDFSDLPRFGDIHPEHVAPAIRSLLTEYRTLIERLTVDPAPPTWDAFVAPMTEASERLSRAWGVVGHLHGVLDVTPWREAYNAMLPEVAGFYAELGQNVALFNKYKAFATSREYSTLNAVRRRIIDREIRDFRLSGAELPEETKPRFKAIQEELSGLAAKFSENLLDATNAHAEWVTDEAGLAGIPPVACAAARAAAEKDGKPGWKFTLHQPSWLPVMQYANDRALRERMYRANVTRASELPVAENVNAPEKWDNGPLIGRILALRAEEAAHLGYRNYAEVSFVPKMADSPAQALAFLRELGAKAKPFAERDLAELKTFAREELGLDSLEPWDIPWASERLRMSRYAYSEQEVRQYFPEHRVLDGLFRVIRQLYGVEISVDEAQVWNEDVRFFRIEKNGKLIGQFYLDLYARDTKRGGAWMDSARSRSKNACGGITTPVAWLACNFPGPVDGKPATFTHDDVLTLFHETGHGLHHLLTRADELPVSGINGVEWDAVELPSQFMENFCWEWDVLSMMTAHVDTSEPLPRPLYDKMIAARNFQSGMQTVRQIEFALFDLLLHSDEAVMRAAASGDVPIGQVLALLDDVRREVAVLFPPVWHRFPHSFSHIFAGGYAAGYYSYKWAEVLSADAFAVFEEAAAQGQDNEAARRSLLDPAVGERFWHEILAVGSSRPAIDSFIAFRGRAPSVDALLRHSGMAK